MTCGVSVPAYAGCLTVAGWPALIGADQAPSQRYLDSYIDKAARSLLELSATAVRRPPSALAVFTAGPDCPTRPDGVHRIPLVCLRP